MFFADTGTLPPPFNLIPNPRVLYDVVRWVRVRAGRGSWDTRARCSAYRCCYVQRRSATPGHDDDAYQQLMSSLIQRYFLAAEDAKNDNRETSSTKRKHTRVISSPDGCTGADVGFYKGGCHGLIHLKGAPPPNYFDPCYRNQTIFWPCINSWRQAVVRHLELCQIPY